MKNWTVKKTTFDELPSDAPDPKDLSLLGYDLNANQGQTFRSTWEHLRTEGNAIILGLNGRVCAVWNSFGNIYGQEFPLEDPNDAECYGTKDKMFTGKLKEELLGFQGVR